MGITKARARLAETGEMPRLSSARRLAVAAATIALSAVTSIVGAGPAAAEVELTFNGGGWGHGIGMSQYGARGFAANGKTGEQILTHYYSGTTVSGTESPATVRIGLQHDVGQLSGSTTGGATLACSTGGSASLAAGSWSYSPIGNGAGRFKRGDGTAILDCWGAVTMAYLPGILTLNGAGGFASHTYRHGTLEMSVNPANAGLVRGIAVIGAEGDNPAIDVYLYGLGEMPSSWPIEALRAQAMAGRTYALDKIARLGQRRESPRCDCALTSTVYDQAYVGYDKETAAYGSQWVQAVQSSRFSTVKYGGQLIQAYYSSSSGGATENNELVWGGTALPYLRGVPDPYDGTGGNPNHRWSVRFTWSALQSKLNGSSDTSVGTLKSIQIVPPLGTSGRVIPVQSDGSGGVKIVGSSGTKRVSGDRLRGILGLKSTLFTIAEVAPADAKTIPAGGYALRSDGGLVPFGGAPAATGDFPFAGTSARAIALGGADGKQGYVLDGMGSLHPVNGAPSIVRTPFSTDIARDLVLRSDGRSGYILDGWGGIHPFGGAPSINPATVTFYEEGQDLARRLVLNSNGTGGYVVEQNGLVHRFGAATAVTTSALSGTTATGLVLRPDGASGYVVTSAGSLVAFGGAPAVTSALTNTSGVDQRADGTGGYLVSSGGTVKSFGSAPTANTSTTTGASRVDVAAIRTPSGYILDAFGGLHPYGGVAPVTAGPYWSGWDIARRAVVGADGNGLIMDAYGGLHTFATGGDPRPARPTGGPYWPGWTIARDLVLLPGSSSAGYILDGYGGLHPFGGAPSTRVSGYWSGWDIAKRVAFNPNGTGGYVMDGFGGLHPFAVGANPMPATPSATAYWSGWDIARDLAVTANGQGYVFDGWGGGHPFGGAPSGSSWSWPGHDAIIGAGTDSSGWVAYADTWGGIHTSPTAAPAVDSSASWPGWPIGRDLAASPSAW